MRIAAVDGDRVVDSLLRDEMEFALRVDSGLQHFDPAGPGDGHVGLLRPAARGEIGVAADDRPLDGGERLQLVRMRRAERRQPSQGGKREPRRARGRYPCASSPSNGLAGRERSRREGRGFRAASQKHGDRGAAEHRLDRRDRQMGEHQKLRRRQEFPAARIRSAATNSAVRITPKPPRTVAAAIAAARAGAARPAGTARRRRRRARPCS